MEGGGGGGGGLSWWWSGFGSSEEWSDLARGDFFLCCSFSCGLYKVSATQHYIQGGKCCAILMKISNLILLLIHISAFCCTRTDLHSVYPPHKDTCIQHAPTGCPGSCKPIPVVVSSHNADTIVLISRGCLLRHWLAQES